VTIDDNSSPVPIRPPRKKFSKLCCKKMTPKYKRKPLINEGLDQTYKTTIMTDIDEMKENCILEPTPIKPERTYKDREVNELTQALQPLLCHQHQTSLDRIWYLIKVARKTKKDTKIRRQNLSLLNLFLALVNERLCGDFVTMEEEEKRPFLVLFKDNNKMQHKSGSESDCQTSVCMHNKIALHSCDKVPTAMRQLREGVFNKIYLRNIPSLLLFNLVYGRSL